MGGKDVLVPRPYPREFRDDVVGVARNRDDGTKPGKSTTESGELREARRRIKLLEQENEVLRRAAAYLSQANLPGKGSTRS